MRHEIDKDIHQSLHNSGLWDALLFGAIANREAQQGGRALSKDQVIEVVEEVLERVEEMFGG